MDLPICPHCGQSVLDDDVDDCPFCGESMSAKPAAKKPAPAKPKAPEEAVKSAAQPSKPASAETKPQTAASPKAKSKSLEAVASPDQPFAVDHAALTNAVALKPSPSPGRAYQVICPMCETPGYTSTKAAGREVKCANPKCLVPIFTCPEPPPEPIAEAPPEPASISTTQFGIISIVALAAIGWGIWFFVLKKDGSSPISQDPPAGVADKSNTETEKTTTESGVVEPKEPVTTEKQGPDLSALRSQAVDKMLEASLVRSMRGPTRPIALRVHWLALAYAQMGDAKNAEAQIGEITKHNDNEPHYSVLPWVEIGWNLRAREESPKDATDKALEFAKTEPASRQDSWVETVSLSALLAATGRSEEAQPLMVRNLGTPVDQELWADILAVSLDKSFNLEAREQTRPLVNSVNPYWSAVVWQLVFHDADNEVLSWVASAPDDRIMAESVIAWADAVAARSILRKQPLDISSLEKAIADFKGFPPNGVVAARAYARIGQRQSLAGNAADAKTMLEKAEAALASLPKTDPLPVLDVEGTYRATFPNVNLGNEIAVAAFEVARLEASMNQADAAWKSIEQGLAALRSEALPLAATKQMQAEIKSNGPFLQAQLQSALALPTDDAARQAFFEYQKKVNEFDKRAKARLQLQADLLGHAARWNLADKVATEIVALHEDLGGDSYFETELPWIVVPLLDGKSTELAKKIEDTLKSKRQTKPKGLAVMEDSARAMEALDIPKVIELLGRGTTSLNDSVRKRWLLKLASRQVVKGQSERMLSFLLALFNADPFLGEDATRIIIALSARNGQGELVWKELEQRNWPPTQRLAGYLGFLSAVDPKVEEEKN